MKERSLVERIVAIFGVLLGSVVWVVRLLYSLVAGALKGKPAEGEEPEAPRSTTLPGKGESVVHDIRERGQHLVADAREKGETLLEDVREKGESLIDDVRHRGEGARDEGNTSSGAASASEDVSPSQHEDLGGVAAANLSSMDEGEETAYAGQAVSESDIGIDRGDSTSELADSDEIRGWVSDEIDLSGEDGEGPYASEGDEDDDGLTWVEVEESTTGAAAEPGYDATWVADQVPDDGDEEGEDEDEDEVPAASRGWREPEDDVLKNDPLYGDFGSSGTGGEVDLRNDEMDEDDSAGMHIVDSPDEPFIEDEEASESFGFVDTGREPAFDTDVEEIGDSREFLSEDSLAADALGRPAGHDAASGDLGPDESPDDAMWDPGASRPDYDVLGAYDGSGVDDFASDEVAEDMLADVTGDEETTGEATTGDQPASGSGSVAWATGAGVIEPGLARPMSAEELQGGTQGAGSGRDAGEPGTHEADAGLGDVASDVASDLAGQTGTADTATGTTMAGAGQSAGQMTSDDAANDERGRDEMTSDKGAPETGGAPSSDAPETEGGSTDAMGVGSGGSFNDVLPETEYASSVGYETLQADESEGGTAFPGDDRFATVSTSATGPSGVTPVGDKETAPGRVRKPAPAGSVRGDGSHECPSDFPIKGNANSHIYHRPTDSSYESTIPEFCFATEADARAAGFRPRKG